MSGTHPTPGAAVPMRPWRIGIRLLGKLKRHPGLSALSVALVIVVLAVELALPRLIGQAVEGVAHLESLPAAEQTSLGTSDAVKVVLPAGIAYVLLSLAGVAARFGGGVARMVLIQRLLAEQRHHLHAAIQRLSLAWHGQRSPGEVLARATRDVEKLRTFYADVVATGGELIAIIIGSLVMIAIASPLLGALTTIFVVAMLAAMLVSGARLRQLWREAGDRYDEVTLAVQECVAGARVIRAFGREADLAARFERVTSAYLDRSLAAARYWGARMPLSNLLFNTSLPALTLVGGILVFRGELAIGALTAAFLYISAISYKLRTLTRLVESTQDAIASSERMDELIEERVETVVTGSVPVPRHADLRFEGVSLLSSTGQTILADIDLEIPHGTTAALVGPSGSGKSSLVSLVPRFQDPSRGRILVGGHDLRTLDLNDLRARTALVFQDTFLFSASIHDNIAFGRPEATVADVREAARQAEALEFIEAMPAGFDTLVGERGITLSGGQKQRLAIARAYLIDPEILIMDDATASVDSGTERRLQAAARAVARGRTTILIAHRLSTVEHADTIFVLDDGRIVERGRHAELLARGGLYAALHHAQTLAPPTRLAEEASR